MGLRAQGLVWVLGLSLGLGGLGLGVLTAQLRRSFDEIETEALRRDAQRLQAGLADLLAQRRRTAQEWSQWTDMRDYVARPEGSAFAQANVSPASVGASGLAGLAVLGLDGRLLNAVRATGEQGLDWPQLLDPASTLGRRLRQAPSPQGACGLVSSGAGGLLIVCQMPVTDSEALLPPTGVLLTADWLTPARLQTLQQVLALRFGVAAGTPPEPADTEALSVPGWAQAARLQRGPEAHALRWSLRDWVQAPVATVSLDWPREMRAQTSLVLRGAQGVVIGLALMLALVLALVIDWRLVRRLRRLQRHLRRLREDERWDQRLPVDGRDEVAQLAQEGNHLLARIDDQVQRLGALSQTDPLTGLGNRRAFDPALELAVGRCRRNRQPLALAMIDVDHFKRFNDQHGHAAGDRALQVLAQGLREVLRRAGDQTARWGGEEFVLLMEGTDADVALGRLALLQQWLAQQPHGPGQALPQAMTVSIGLALLRAGEEPAALLARADAALYRAKDAGRDRVEIAV